MVNLTLSEATLNAVRAALDLRVVHLEGEINLLRHRIKQRERLGYPVSGPLLSTAQVEIENWQRALVWNIAALHETKTAVEDFAEANCTDHPASATWTAATVFSR